MGLDDDDTKPKDQEEVHDAPAGARATGQDDFVHGLCSCFTDCEVCLCSWCCPCIQFGQNWERLNPHNDPKPSDTFLIWALVYCGTVYFLDYWLFFLSSTFLRWWTRVEFRRALGYRERHVCDFLSACCCACCMIAQDGNEIKAFKAGKLGK